MDKKSYGLIIRKKVDKIKPIAKSIFDDDSDSGNEAPTLKPKLTLAKSSKVKVAEQKLIKEDPTIYEYDTLYDSMKEAKSHKKEVEVSRKEPRYISSLLKAADKRKKDQDRRQEKKIQIERTKEGDEFNDKEAFVTSAYKQKMQEMETEEQKERLQNQLDDMMDVTKQNDLSGFYRHYLKQSVGEEKIPEFGHGLKTEIKVEEEVSCNESSFRMKQTKKSTNYRTRNVSDSPSEDEERPHKMPKKSLKTDVRRAHDKSRDQDMHEKSKYSDGHKEGDNNKKHIYTAPQKHYHSSSSHTKKEKDETKNEDISHQIQSTSKSIDQDADDDFLDSDSESVKEQDQSKYQEKATTSKSANTDHDLIDSDAESTKDEDSKRQQNKTNNKKSDISLKFVKRTVGEAFDRAQARYFKRMSARSI